MVEIFSTLDKVEKHPFSSFPRKREASDFSMLWMPDQVRHNCFETLYETINLGITNKFSIIVYSLAPFLNPTGTIAFCKEFSNFSKSPADSLPLTFTVIARSGATWQSHPDIRDCFALLAMTEPELIEKLRNLQSQRGKYPQNASLFPLNPKVPELGWDHL